jgi:phospholipase/carboxylesterase
MVPSRHSGPEVLMERWGSARARIAVLAVHGRAQNPEIMKGYSARFALEPTVGAAFYAPRAAGDSWYPEPFLVPMHRNAKAVDESLRIIDRCLEQLRAAGFGPGHIVLWGFSQGACLLSHHLLIRRPQVAAAILFTGGYIGEQPLEPPTGPTLTGLPVIVRSIENDPFVPPSRVRDTAALLQAAGAEVDLRIDPGNEHVVTDEAYARAAESIAVLTANSSATEAPGR